MDVLYICNRKKCPNCSEECKYTKDPRFAKNFEFKEEEVSNGEYFMYFVEKDNACISACLVGGE